MKPALIVHGGAWDIPDEAVDGCKSGCQRALAAAWCILSKGGNALEAIESAVMVLEDDPVFDAGYGSHLNRDGRVECDAMVMDGATLRAGAACTLQRVKNPIRLARAILENCPHMMLVAEGAERFATEQGIALCKPKELVSEVEQEAWLKCREDPCGVFSGQLAAREAVHLLAKRAHGTGGLILLDCYGNPGFAFNTPRMAYGYVALDGSFVAAV